jgi:regulator of RNase E activity RraA
MTHTTHTPSPVVLEPGASTIVEDYDRPDPELLQRFRELPAAIVGDAMQRMGVLDAQIQSVWEGGHLVGPAFTVWVRSGDNRGIHEAFKHVKPGDVIVVNGGADVSRALLGELVGGRAKQLGVAGFVVDGAARDAQGLAEYEMPVFARALTPAGPYKTGPHVISTPVAVGGVVVSPGDIVVADGDGVVVVPLRNAAHVAEVAEARHAAEVAKRAGIDAELLAQTSSPIRSTQAGPQ